MMAKKNRTEILKYLNGISPTVELVMLPTEEALDCTCISKDGYTQEWMGIHDWPALSISGVNEDDINVLRKTISRSDLLVSDVEMSVVGKIYNAFASGIDERRVLAEIYTDSMKIDDSGMYEVYALNIADCESPSIILFTDYKEFEEKFVDCYFSVDVGWDELPNEELAEWQEKIENGLCGIPLITLENDKE